LIGRIAELQGTIYVIAGNSKVELR
jgi:hypothetical protein